MDAPWPSITVPTTCMCERQCSSAAGAVARLDEVEQPLLRTDSAPAYRQRPEAVVGLAHRGHGPHDDLVEHLGDDAQRLVAGRATRAVGGSAAFATPNSLRVLDRVLLRRAISARSSLTAAVRPRAPSRCDAGRDRFEQAPRLEDVGERHVARLQQECGRAGGHPLVRLVDDDATAHAAHDGDEALGFEDPQRLAQRRAGHAEAFDEVGLVTQRVAFGQLAGDDQRAAARRRSAGASHEAGRSGSSEQPPTSTLSFVYGSVALVRHGIRCPNRADARVPDVP